MIVWRAYWPGRVRRPLARIAEEDRPDDLVRQLLAELDGLERDVDVRWRAGAEVLELGDRAAEDDGGLRGASRSDALRDRALQAAVLEAQVGLDERDA